MNRFFIIGASLLLFAGCKSDEQKLADYQASVEKANTEFTEMMTRIQQDTTLTDDERSQQAEAYYETAVENLKKDGLAAIRKSPSAPVAVEALKNIYSLLELEELESVMASLKGDILNDEFIVAQKAFVESKTKTSEGKMFTDFTVVQDENDPEGSTVKFSDYVGKGKYMLVDFWASWCGPCKREIPNLVSIYEKYRGEDFDVLSVAVWDEPKASVDTAAAYGVSWNHIINAQRIPTEIYGIQGIPHIILFGPDGTILKRDLRGEDIERAVSSALGR